MIYRACPQSSRNTNQGVSVSTEFDCLRISVIVHRSASDKLGVVHSSPACLGLSLNPVKERKRVSGKVSNQRFVNSRVWQTLQV